ncbi:hypothetical protein V1478_006461 [Vespula squamosa]|uniref:Uncharacterized protein n=1 Tax=Vespula squamosa TaxID=30214 RepID=A0ABD2B7X0_VESSQ
MQIRESRVGKGCSGEERGAFHAAWAMVSGKVHSGGGSGAGGAGVGRMRARALARLLHRPVPTSSTGFRFSTSETTLRMKSNRLSFLFRSPSVLGKSCESTNANADS